MSHKFLHSHEVVLNKLSPLQLVFQSLYPVTYYFKNNTLIIQLEAKWNMVKNKLMIYDHVISNMNQLSFRIFDFRNEEAVILQKFKDPDSSFSLKELKLIISRYQEAYDDYLIINAESSSSDNLIDLLLVLSNKKHKIF